MATQLAEWANGEGALVKVPPNAKAALEAKYRGQRNLGEKALRVLGFSHNTAMLKATQPPFIFCFCFATKKYVRENELPAAPSENTKALLAA